jgi:predicted DNA-binding transcriptional regulator AlpA
MQKSFMNTRDAAVFLGLSASTLNKMRCYGEGPRYYKFGKPVRYMLDDLIAWASDKLRLVEVAKPPLAWV